MALTTEGMEEGGSSTRGKRGVMENEWVNERTLPHVKDRELGDDGCEGTDEEEEERKCLWQSQTVHASGQMLN